MSDIASLLEEKRWFRYLVMVAIIATLLSSLNVHKYYVLETRGQQAQAEVVKVDAPPSGNGLCGAVYRYRTGSAGFTQTRIAGNGACLTPLGSRHSVYYDPASPETILIDANPKTALVNEIVGILVVSLLLPLVFLGMEAAKKALGGKITPPRDS